MFFTIRKRVLLSLFFCVFLFCSLTTVNAGSDTSTQRGEDKTLGFRATEKFQPFQMVENGKLTGFQIELLKELFKDSKYTVDMVVDSKIDDSYEDVIFFRSDGTDIEAGFKNSNSIYSQGFSAFTLDSAPKRNITLAALREMRVGADEDSYSYVYAEQNGLATTTYANTDEGVKALHDGEIDVWLGNVQNIQHYVARGDTEHDLIYHSEYIQHADTYLALPEGDLVLEKFVNARIKEMQSSGSYEEIYVQFFMEHSHEYLRQQGTVGAFRISAIVCCGLILIILFTARKVRKAYEEIKSSKMILDNLLDYGNRFIIIWKTDFSHYEVNDYFRAVFGLEGLVNPQNIGMRFGEKADYASNPTTNADEIKDGRAVVRKVIDIYGIEREISWVTVSVAEKKGVDTLLTIGSDLTEKNLLKRQLKISDERYQLAMDSASIAMVFINNNGEIPYISAVGTRLIGLGDISTCDMEILGNRIHPSDRQALETGMLNCINNGEVANCEVRALTGTGKFRWLAFKFSVISNELMNGDSCVVGVFYDINDNKEKDLRIERLAFQDDLTGIFNRQKFLSSVKETLINAKFNGLRYAILTINLDKFHRFNDIFGVEVGDKILRAVANIIKYNPYGNDCICARLGNDEFACLVRLGAHEEHLEQYVIDLAARIQKYSSSEYEEMKMTISVGSCIFPDQVDDYHEVYERSIFSMRIAKSNPSIIYQAYDSDIKEMILNREILEKEIQEAIEKQQFELYYQPKIDIDTEKIVGAEALIRWNHPTRGVVSPLEFIPIAEEIGIIGEIGKWTLQTACNQNKIWQDRGLTNIKVSVNITSIEFYQSDIVGIVRDTLEETGLSPKWLEIELTESMALVDIDETILKMTALRKLGVGISMDDFGTGYSSLSYIQNLPIDELKLDKSFINKIAFDDTTKNIASTVINLAQIVGLVVVAEGVELREQFEVLKEMKCNIIQGYLFARPLKKDDIIYMMHNDDAPPVVEASSGNIVTELSKEDEPKLFIV